MRMNSFCFRLIIAVLSVSLYCDVFAQDTKALADSTLSLSPAKKPEIALNESKIINYRYYLFFGKRFVQLKDGYYKSGSNPDDYISARLEHYAIGDLNKDGNDDAAAILSSQGMGSGTFYELTALVLKDRKISQTNSIVVGDRIKITSLSIESGEIILDAVTHKTDDPSCCPSQRYIKRLKLDGKELVETRND